MRGYRVVREVLGEFEGEPVKAFVIWLPMVRGDNEAAARALLAATGDARIRGYWDGKRLAGGAFGRTLRLKLLGLVRATAWDVYLVYPQDVRWTADDPPAPAHWEHQLSGLEGAPPDCDLDPARLAEQVGVALRDVRSPAFW